MLKIVIALVLLGHGIGHSMGPLGLLKVATINPAWHGDSWLLTGPAGTTVTNVVGMALWSVALVGFALVAAVVIGWLPEAWWQPLAIVSSVASIAGSCCSRRRSRCSARSARSSSMWRCSSPSSGCTGFRAI
jgi:hypothetical protein